MKLAMNRVIGLTFLNMTEVVEEITNLDCEYAVVGDSIYVDSSAELKSVPESAQHVLKFDTEETNNGAGWDFIFGCKSFKEIVEKTAEEKGVDYEYFNPEIICIEYLSNAHFNSGKMDQPDKYFVNRNDDLDELAEKLGWIKFRKEGMKVWFDEILLLVEVAAQPSSEPIFVKDGFYTIEQYKELQQMNEDLIEAGATSDLYKVVGWVETEHEAVDWLYHSEPNKL